MRRIPLFLILLMSFLTANARYIQSVQIGTEKGLSCNAVRTLSRDTYGRLWVGTVNGANLVSNGSVRPFQSFTIDGQSMVIGEVMSIGCTDRAIIASSYCIFDYNPDTDSTRLVTYNDRIIRTDYTLLKGDSAYFYNVPLSALMMYDLTSHKTEMVAQFPTESQFVFSKILNVPGEPDHLILVEDKRGFYRLDLSTGRLTHIEELGSNVISKSVFIDSHGILWAAYFNLGVTGYDIKAAYAMKVHTETPGTVRCLTELSGNRILVCTDNSSIYLFAGNSGETLADLSNLNYISNCALASNTENEIILGTIQHGITTVRESFFHSVDRNAYRNNNGTDIVPIAAYQSAGGELWFGTAGYGLCSFNEDTEQYVTYPTTNGMRIAGICDYDNNNLLLIDRASGLMLFNKETGEISPSIILSGSSMDVSQSRLKHLRIETTPDGDIMLFNCSGQHFIYRKETARLDEIRLQKNGDENKGLVEDIMVSPSHAIVSCNGCIYEIDYKTLLARLIFQNPNERERATQVAVDSNDRIWVCSPNGLTSYDPRSNTVSHILDHGDDGVFLTMDIDRSDRLWITTDKAQIIMYDTKDPEDNNQYTYYARDCGTMLNFLTHFSIVSKKGYLYLPHTSGLMILNPDDKSMQLVSEPYPVSLIKVQVDGKTIPAVKKVRIPHRFSSLDIHLAVNRFDQNRPVTLKYQLYKKGHMYPIMEVVTDNTVFKLPKSTQGTYSLEISQRTIQGWSEPIEILSFNVARPFMMTIPGYLLLLVLIVSIIIAVAKVSISIKQAETDMENHAQEKLQKDDTIIMLSNLAHELRTPLSLMYNPAKDLLDDNNLKGAYHDKIQRLFDQINKMTDMVKQILDKGYATPVAAPASDMAQTPKPAQAVSIPDTNMEVAAIQEVDFDTKSMTLLIVDDQDDILQFIKEEYSSLFKTVYTAHDGKEALDLIRQKMPNVVVSDIMMPRMNGFELCKTIKTDLELSSIPVILLTSRSDPKNQDMGYKMGADSFLPKPFDSKLLYKIIRSQLKNRFDIRRQYASSFFTSISEDQTFSAADEQFVLKLNRFIRDNLSNSMLGVDMIVEHMNVSRTTLFNKMNSLVGTSTNKYIRRIRMEAAKEMLAKTSKSVGTIAEETGFSESQYFSTVFKQETGMTPSQYKESLRNT